MRKSAYRDVLWVKNIDYEILLLFIISTPLLLTSTKIDSQTKIPTQILLPMLFCIYLTICFMKLINFTKILCVSLTNRFVWPIIQLYFSISFALCFVTCYTHLVHMRYALGVRVKLVPIIVDVSPSFPSSNTQLFPLLSWLICGVRLML